MKTNEDPDSNLEESTNKSEMFDEILDKRISGNPMHQLFPSSYEKSSNKKKKSIKNFKKDGMENLKFVEDKNQQNESLYNEDTGYLNPDFNIVCKYKQDVFNRLIKDAKIKQETRKSSITIDKSNLSNNKRSSINPQTEKRLMSYTKEHKNWIIQERFLKQSKEMSQLKNAPMILPNSKKIIEKKSRLSPYKYNNTKQQVILVNITRQV